MRRFAPLLIAAFAFAGIAVGDEVVIAGKEGRASLPYPSVTVTGVKDGKLLFRFGQSLKAEPLSSLASVTLTDQPEYQQAEKLLADGKALDAAAAFEKLAESKSDPVAALSRWRAMFAYDKAAQIDKAVGLWLGLADAEGSAGVFAGRPRNLGAKGSDANAKAIALLAAKLKVFGGGGSGGGEAAHKQAIQTALFELYTRQGDLAKAVAIGDRLPHRPVPVPEAPAGGGTQTQPLRGVSVSAASLRLAETLLAQGQPDKALAEIQSRLNRLREDELAEAMELSGLAHLALAGPQTDAQSDEPAKRVQLVQAGLDFMRVFVYWPDAAGAPRCLLLAGDVNARLGNARAAELAYRKLASQYEGAPAAQGEPSWVARAEAAIQALKNQAGQPRPAAPTE